MNSAENLIEHDSDVIELSDADLEQAVSGQATPPDTTVETKQPESPEVEATPGAPKEEPAPAPSLETLQNKVKTLKEQYERQLKSNTDKERFIQRQANELGQLRQLKAALQTRRAELAGIDPAKQFIESPHAFRESLAESTRLEAQIAQVEHAEQQATQQEQHRAIQQRNFDALQEHAPDLPDLMPDMLEFLREKGKDDPQSIAAFQANPFAFPAHNVLAIAEAVRARREMKALQAQLDAAKKQPAELLSRIESAAKSKPMQNAAGGTATQGGIKGVGNLSDIQIRNLSTKELDDLLSSLK